MSKYHYVNSYKNKTRQQWKPFTQQNIRFVKKTYKTAEYFLYCGDALEFLDFVNEPIHLTLTSPPYNVGVAYEGYEDDLTSEDYFAKLEKIFAKIYEISSSGGRVVLNVPYMIKFGKGKRTFVADEYRKVLQRVGFEIVDEIVWVKARNEEEARGVSGRSTAWGSWCKPTSPRMRPIHEILIVAIKPGSFTYTVDPDITPEEFKSWTVSTWFIPSVSHPVHPAVFPKELVRRVVKLYTVPGQNVLDPFMGVGTTGIVSLELGRRFFGSEIVESYFLEALSVIGKIR